MHNDRTRKSLDYNSIKCYIPVYRKAHLMRLLLFIPYVKWVIKVLVLYHMDKWRRWWDSLLCIYVSLHHLLKLNILKYITLCDQRTFSVWTYLKNNNCASLNLKRLFFKCFTALICFPLRGFLFFYLLECVHMYLEHVVYLMFLSAEYVIYFKQLNRWTYVHFYNE